jgi:hypothetical protein
MQANERGMELHKTTKKSIGPLLLPYPPTSPPHHLARNADGFPSEYATTTFATGFHFLYYDDTIRVTDHISIGLEIFNNVLSCTYPACFGLILERLLGVLRGGLHVVHRVLHVVFYPVNHLPLRAWV